jgi:hypothetical protein
MINLFSVEWLMLVTIGRVLRMANFRSHAFKWVLLPAIFILFPLFLTIGVSFLGPAHVLYPTGNLINVLSWFTDVVGTYYAETIGLIAVNLCWWAMATPKVRKLIIRPVVASGAMLIGTLFLVAFHSEFQHLLIQNPAPAAFFEAAQNGQLGWTMAVGAFLHGELTTDSRIHGAFGIVFGLVCMMAYNAGLRSRPSKQLVESARSLVSITSLMAVAVTVMIFGLSTQNFFGSVRHVFSINAILIGTISLAFGVIMAGTGRRIDPLGMMLGALVAFVLGFTMGDLIVPFTRVPLVLNLVQISQGNLPLYIVFVGTYTFMTMAIVSLTVLSILLSDRELRTIFSRTISSFST